MYIEKAEELIRRIHKAGINDKEWLQLEEDVSEFFATLPKNQIDIIDDLFITEGAGEMLDMVCSGIRYAQENHKHP